MIRSSFLAIVFPFSTALDVITPKGARMTKACCLRALAVLVGLVLMTGAASAATVAIPSFNPAAGTYTSIQTVTISTPTNGATIHYTTDGSTPSTTDGTVYSSPISIAATTTLKCIAYKSGSTNSAVKSGTYTIKVAAPVFSPAAGIYTSAQKVTIASATSGATIRYTTDGSAPTETNGTVYSTPVNIGATATLKAIAYVTGCTDSAVTCGTYTINLPKTGTPVFSPVAGTYTGAQTVAMTSTTSGASIRYTTDGSAPTETNGTLYSRPVAISATTTLKAIGYASGCADSAVTSGTYAIKVAAPVFSPAAGTYTSAQTVTITSATSGATIRYTTDGSAPTETNGTVYSTPVNIGATVTLKAIAYVTGCTDSAVTRGAYTINLPKTGTPVFSPAAGTYTSAQTVTITSATSGATIRYTTDGSAPTKTNGTVYSTPVSIGATTTLKAIAYATGYADAVTSGTFTIKVVAPVFSPVAGTYTGAQTVAMTSTTSGASIRYTTDGSAPTETNGTLYSHPVAISATTTLKAIGYASGCADSTVTSGTYTIKVAAPVFSPAAGTYTSAQTVTITSATSGATIRYTTDGSAPTKTNGTVYSTPVSIGATTTLKAIAYATGYADSAVKSGVYTINLLPTAVAPTFNPAAGTYISVQTVTITSATSGASIRYTTDGNTPSATAGTLYSKPLVVGTTTTLKAIAYKNGYIDSTVTSGFYTISLLSPPSGLATSNASATGCTLSWTPSTGGAGGIASYDIYINGVLVGNSTTPSFNLTSLRPLTTYNVTVVAKDAAGNASGTSNVLTFTTPADTTPPTAPSNLASSAITTNTFTLTWTASTDDVGTTNYLIYNGATQLGTSTTTAYNATGLTAGTTYTITVKAQDAAGNTSTASNVLSVTTSTLANQPPTVTLTAPTANATFTLPTTVTLTATANDPDGTISKVEFFNGTTSLGSVSAPASLNTYTLPFTPSTPGLASLTAVATDNLGATGISAAVSIALLPSLPYTADFETSEGYVLGSLNNQLGWNVSAGAAQIVSGAAAHGTQYVSFNPGTTAAVIDQEFGSAASNPAVAYVDFDAKPVAGTDVTTGTLFDLDAARIACVLNGSTGQLSALDGDGLGSGIWKTLAPAMPLTTGNVATVWQHITVRLNYTAQTYDLYLNGAMIAADLKFRLAVTPYVSWFSIKGHTAASATLDDLYAGATNPLFADTNNNGIDDAWETAHGLSLLVDNRQLSPTGNGVTVLQAYLTGTDPRDFYNGATPILTIVSGNNQAAAPGQFNAQPLVILVANAAGTSLANAPVTFTVTGGGGLLATTNTGTPASSSTLSLHTASDGTARVYYQQPAVGITSQISITAGSATAIASSKCMYQPLLVAGGDQTLFIDSMGNARAWGRNALGQLGDGTIFGRAQMQRVNLACIVKTAAISDGHGLAVSSDGQVYAWGNNYYGQLGDGTSANRLSPVLVSGLNNVTQVAAGDDHSLALRSDGTVWAWGGNQSGQLGDGTTFSRNAPVQVSGLSQIVGISAGAKHSAAVAADGTVWVWGSNEFGQLCDTTISRAISPRALLLTNITTVVSGRHHLLALSQNGTVWGWGNNHSGQLGLGGTSGSAVPQVILSLPAIVSVAAGNMHSVVLSSDGSIYVWGGNQVGQLGNGSTETSLTPTQLSITDVRVIAAGRDHVVIMKTDGSLYSWGANILNQLGSASTSDYSNSPVPVLPLID